MNLRYRTFSNGESFPALDFTDDKSNDLLHVNTFFHNELQTYRKNKLTTAWIVRDENQPVAYFTVSMNAIEVTELEISEKVDNTTTSRYPAVLLGQIGVDKKYRGKDISLAICDFCAGLAVEIGEKIACRYLILQTSQNLIPVYEKARFVKSLKKQTKNGKVWMYRKLV